MNRLSRVFVPVGALALLFSEILLIAACFLVVTFLIVPVDPTVFLFADNGLLRIVPPVVPQVWRACRRGPRSYRRRIPSPPPPRTVRAPSGWQRWIGTARVRPGSRTRGCRAAA